MFQRKYYIKIYSGGKHLPDIEFYVNAQHIEIEGHSIRIDGVALSFSENHYIAVDKMS